MNKKIIKITVAMFSAIALLFLSSTCSKTNNRGSSPPSPSSTNTNFTSIDVHGSGTVLLVPDTINKDDSISNANVIYHSNGQLAITGSGFTKVSVKDISALTVTGSVTVFSNDSLNLTQLLLTSHGSSLLGLKLKVQNSITLTVTGSSDVYNLTGKCPKIYADVNGSPQINAYNFITADGSVTMNGSGVCQ